MVPAHPRIISDSGQLCPNKLRALRTTAAQQSCVGLNIRLINRPLLGKSMAYRRSRGKARKLQPAVMQLAISVPTGESYVDLALCASIVNRRGYKQENSNWAVSQFEVFQPASAGTGILRIEKLPETWVYQNAYQKSRALWNRMNDQVLDQEEGIQGKWADFKIYMDETMTTYQIQDSANPTGRILTPQTIVGGASVLTQADFTAAAVPRADWSWSEISIPNDAGSGVTVDYTLHAVGANGATSKGMIQGYAESRSRPNEREPNVVSVEGWMTQLFDDGEQLDEIRDNLEDDNDRPPYALGGGAGEFYPGGSLEQSGLQIHSFCNFTSTTVSGKNAIMGGMFQQGLMKLNNSTDSALTVIIHMVPGDHRGYMVVEC